VSRCDDFFNLESEMAVMMILMVVLLVMAGPHGHMGSHRMNAPPAAESSQPHERDAAMPGAEKP
jgi:hypothetical protein